MLFIYIYNNRGKVNPSRPSHYDIGEPTLLYRRTTVDVLQYLDSERWKQRFSLKMLRRCLAR